MSLGSPPPADLPDPSRDPAQHAFAHARRLAEAGRADEAISAWHAAGDAAYLRHQLQTAIDCYDAADCLMPDEPDSLRKRYGLREKVRSLRLMGRIEAAEVLAQDVAERSVAAGDAPFATSCRVLLGFLYCDNGRIDEAIDLLYDVLLGDQTVIPTVDLSTITATLAYAYFLKGQYSESIEHGQQAVQIARTLGNVAGEGEALSMVANSYVDTGMYREAIALYEAARVVQRQCHDLRGEAVSDINMGYCLARMGEEVRANEALDRAMGFADAHDARKTASFVHQYRGVLCEELGRPNEALRHYALAHALRVETGQGAQAVESLGAIERLRYRAGYPRTLPDGVDEVARWLETAGPEGMEDFASAYVTCVALLEAARQPDRARTLLAEGQAHLNRRAALIRDGDMRDAYLAIPTNRTLRLTRLR